MKKQELSKSILQTMVIGVLAGMRANAGPTVASHLLSAGNSGEIKDGPLKFMSKPLTATITKVLLAGELVGDKLPNTPNRTAIGGVVGRVLSGALAGGAIFKASGNNALTGALIGSVMAIGSTYGCFYLRRFLDEETGIPDPYIGGMEDALVIGAGAALIITA